jgi:urease subunit alpha
MVHNTRTGTVEVDHRTAAVTLDGRLLRADPVQRTSLSRLYLI